MVSTRAFVAALAALSSSTVNAYWRQVCSLSQTGRIDPIISPGQVSSHVHKIAGGSNIGLSSQYADMRDSACTSCEIQADKSGYWTPQLYYEHPNGSFEEVPNSGMTVYYLGRGDNRENIVPFPAGFKMLSGNPFARSYDNETMTFNNASVAGRPLSDRVSFNCLDTQSWPETPAINRTNCANGLRAQIQFQSCWNGVDLYLDNNAHVDYMSQIDNGVCSEDFPVQLVHLFFEVLYGVNDVDQNDGGRFVFAYGDPTGYGFHGDFLMGWDEDVLAESLEQCANTDNGGAISACAPLAAVDTGSYAANCPEYAPNGIPLINETVTGMIGTSLPGCINVVNGPTWATLADITCPAGTAQPAVNTFAAQTPTNYTSMTPGEMFGVNGWEYVSCYGDLVNGTRALAGTSTSGSSMTIENCQAYCTTNNYRFAGVENGDECYCSSIISSTYSNNQTGCSQVCAGNNTEFCGGADRINIFNNTLSTATIAAPGAGATSTAAGTYMGCVTDGVNGRTLSGASYSSSSNMTLETCRAYCDAHGYYLSGTEYATQCYCGNALLNGGALLSSNSTCDMICTGANTESCGGPNRLSVFASNTLTAPITAAGISNYTYQGCWVDNTGGQRALAAASYVNSSMTLEICVSYCSNKGYSYAGTEYADECYCGNTLASGTNATLTDCSMQCAGNKTEMCGAGNRLSVYYNNSTTSASSSSSSASSTTSSSKSSTSSSTTSSVTTTSASSTTSSTSGSSSVSSTTSVLSSTTATSSSTTLASTTTTSSHSSTSATNTSSTTTPTSTSTSTSATSTITTKTSTSTTKASTTSKATSTTSTTTKASSTTTTTASAVKARGIVRRGAKMLY